MNEQKLDQLQQAAFGYFLREVNPANGLVADNSRENSPCSIAVVGFALSSYPVAVARGWMTRADAVDRSLAALRFFHDSDQTGSPEATGYKGFYYHFLDMHSGARLWRSERGYCLMIGGEEAAVQRLDPVFVALAPSVEAAPRLPPAVRARVSVEAASPFGWERYVGPGGAIIGVDRFGASAPGSEVMARYGFTVEHVVATAKAVLARSPLRKTGEKIQ